jgi:hypothetical protein
LFGRNLERFKTVNRATAQTYGDATMSRANPRSIAMGALAALAVLSLVQPCRAGWTTANPTFLEAFYPGNMVYPHQQTGSVGIIKPPLTATLPFNGDGSQEGAGVTGTLKLGNGTVLEDSLGADVYSDYVSISGVPGAGYPIAYTFRIRVLFSNWLAENSLTWEFGSFLRVTGYLAPGDSISYDQEGILTYANVSNYPGFREANQGVHLAGDINTPGAFVIDMSSPYIPLGYELDLVNMEADLYLTIYKGTGGGTTIWNSDPGVGVDSPDAPPNPVPEPSSLSLLGLGAACFGVFARRRRR